MFTTLQKIWLHGPCASGWKILLRGLGHTVQTPGERGHYWPSPRVVTRDEYYDQSRAIVDAHGHKELAITTILGINGTADALWALRTIEGRDADIRRFAAWMVKQTGIKGDDSALDELLDMIARDGEPRSGDLRIAHEYALQEMNNPSGVFPPSVLLRYRLSQPDARIAASWVSDPVASYLSHEKGIAYTTTLAQFGEELTRICAITR